MSTGDKNWLGSFRLSWQTFLSLSLTRSQGLGSVLGRGQTFQMYLGALASGMVSPYMSSFA